MKEHETGTDFTQGRGDAEGDSGSGVPPLIPETDFTRRRGDAEGMGRSELDDITGAIVDASVKIHQNLGPGLLESVYEVVLARVLAQRGFSVQRQKAVSFEYERMVFEEGFRLDLLVEERVVVELKSVEKLAPIHSKQLLTYLRLMHLPVGLLINFGAATLKEGLHRIVNKLPASASPRLRVNQKQYP
jgi:iron complex transport system substrate-binding protein